jgi:hypothetical protein
MLVATASYRKSPCHGVVGWEGPMASLGITKERKCLTIPFSWYMKLHQWVVGSQHLKAISVLILKV